MLEDDFLQHFPWVALLRLDAVVPLPRPLAYSHLGEIARNGAGSCLSQAVEAAIKEGSAAPLLARQGTAAAALSVLGLLLQDRRTVDEAPPPTPFVVSRAEQAIDSGLICTACEARRIHHNAA